MKKSLQKFTDISLFKNKKDFIDYLKDDNKRIKEVIKELYKRLNDSLQNNKNKDFNYINIISECYDLVKDKKSKKKFKNTMYEYNHTTISICIHNYIKEYAVFPRLDTITEQTGLSRQTIYKHLKSGLYSNHNTLVLKKLEYLSTNALTVLYKIGVKENNVNALKLFIELSNKFKPTPVNNINNYIQINNLKISSEEFQELPSKALTEIEQIIIENKGIKLH